MSKYSKKLIENYDEQIEETKAIIDSINEAIADKLEELNETDSIEESEAYLLITDGINKQDQIISIFDTEINAIIESMDELDINQDAEKYKEGMTRLTKTIESRSKAQNDKNNYVLQRKGTVVNDKYISLMRDIRDLASLRNDQIEIYNKAVTDRERIAHDSFWKSIDPNTVVKCGFIWLSIMTVIYYENKNVFTHKNAISLIFKAAPKI